MPAAADAFPAQQMRSPIIRADFNDRFAFGIQNGRSVHMVDPCSDGKNDFVATVQADSATMFDPATFIVNSARDSRYSPYAGICIDPFGTAVPGDGGYPGMSAAYKASAAGSSRCTFERVRVSRFVVGVMVTPNGTTQNAENFSFRDCVLTYNRTNFAMGQSQSRCVYWSNGDVAFGLIGFDGSTYGVQQGYCPHIVGANMAGKYLFNVGVRWGEPIVVRDVHAESFASIGGFGAAGAASASAPVVFDGCTFSFSISRPAASLPTFTCSRVGRPRSGTASSIKRPRRNYCASSIPKASPTATSCSRRV